VLPIYHTHDAELVNRITNSDGVREFIHTHGEVMDLKAAVEPLSTQTGIVALTNGEDAVSLFVITGPATYQVHTAFASTCRGRRAIDTGKAMLAWMRKHGARVIWGSTSRANHKACLFNRLMDARALSPARTIRSGAQADSIVTVINIKNRVDKLEQREASDSAASW
jgi:hypothetical protein